MTDAQPGSFCSSFLHLFRHPDSLNTRSVLFLLVCKQKGLPKQELPLGATQLGAALLRVPPPALLRAAVDPEPYHLPGTPPKTGDAKMFVSMTIFIAEPPPNRSGTPRGSAIKWALPLPERSKTKMDGLRNTILWWCVGPEQ